MAKTFVAGFVAGAKRYEQSVDITTEDSFITEAGSDTTLFFVNPGGWVHDRERKIVGRIMIDSESKRYFYTSKDGSVKVNTKFSDRLEAERDVLSVMLRFGIQDE